MSTVVAAPSPAPLPVMDLHPSPRSYAPLAPAVTTTPAEKNSAPADTPEKSTPPGANGKRSPLSYVATEIWRTLTDLPVSFSTMVELANAYDFLARQKNPSHPTITINKEKRLARSFESGCQHRPTMSECTNSSHVFTLDVASCKNLSTSCLPSKQTLETPSFAAIGSSPSTI